MTPHWVGWFLKGDQDHIKQAHWAAEDELTIGQGTMPAEWKVQATVQIAEYFRKNEAIFPSVKTRRHGVSRNDLGAINGNSVLEPPRPIAKWLDRIRPEPLARPLVANPLLLLIPCHRVVGADGSMTGYAGGTERKEELLRLEGAHHPQQLRLVLG